MTLIIIPKSNGTGHLFTGRKAVLLLLILIRLLIPHRRPVPPHYGWLNQQYWQNNTDHLAGLPELPQYVRQT